MSASLTKIMFSEADITAITNKKNIDYINIIIRINFYDL